MSTVGLLCVECGEQMEIVWNSYFSGRRQN